MTGPTKTAKEIFAEAAALAPIPRAEFLDSACGTNIALRAEVDRLLHAYDAAAGARFLSSPTAGAPTPAGAPTEGPGAKIGPYKLLEIIGEGGFGTVFMAEQEEPVRRRVALKIIKWGMDTRQVVARFEQERQALAMMDHPSIAKVLDAGATSTGRPYFVMELVRGDPITHYCDASNLPLADRLALFAKVCQAVQHAHTKGVIHRDLKPGNVLVTVIDGLPIPKVIDFGVAKATSTRLTEKTLFTEFRQFIGTPEYMSPEQAEMSGVDIDTRSDVYSLGVLLYELLTGVTPFDARQLRAGAFEEIQRIIREQDPPKPSTRLSALSQPQRQADANAPSRTPPLGHYATPPLPQIASHRHSDPRTLLRTIRGDLDCIVMKCLEKDRTRRYDTAGGLASDIQRHLAGDAVDAAPPSTSYRLRKFIRRHKVGVAAGAAVAATLLCGMLGTSYALRLAIHARDMEAQARENAVQAQYAAESARRAEQQQRDLAQASADQAQEQARRARAEADNAAAERERSEAVTAFMQETLQGAGPSVARGRDTSMLRAMMDAAAQRIESGELKDAPEAELRLRSTIGQTYRSLAEFQHAEQNLTKALDLARQTHSPDHPEIAARLRDLADLRRDTGRAPEAEAMYREAIEMYRRLGQGESAEAAATLESLAAVTESQGRLPESEAILCEVLERYRRLHPDGHADLARTIGSLGRVSQAQGRLTEAEAMYREALGMDQRLYPGDHPAVAEAVQRLGTLTLAMGRPDQARPMIEQALAMQQRLFPGEHPSIADSMSTLAAINMASGHAQEALPLYEQTLRMRRTLLGADHPATLASLLDLARCHHAQGQHDQAIALAREASAAAARLFPEGHPIRRNCERTLQELESR